MLAPELIHKQLFEIATGDYQPSITPPEYPYPKGEPKGGEPVPVTVTKQPTQKITIQSPFPIAPLITPLEFFPKATFTIGGNGGVDVGLKSLPEVITTEPEPTETILYPSPVIPFEPKIGEDVPEAFTEAMYKQLGETPATPFPITEPVSLGIPDIFGGLKEVGKWVLIGIAGLAGIYLLGKIIGRRH